MFVAHSAPSLPRLFYCKWSGLIGRREGGWGVWKEVTSISEGIITTLNDRAGQFTMK